MPSWSIETIENVKKEEEAQLNLIRGMGELVSIN